MSENNPSNNRDNRPDLRLVDDPVAPEAESTDEAAELARNILSIGNYIEALRSRDQDNSPSQAA